MSKIPVDDPTKQPTAEQLQRAEIAAIIFTAHGEINVAMGRAAIDIVDGAPIPASLDIMQKKIEGLMRMTHKAAYLKAGLTP